MVVCGAALERPTSVCGLCVWAAYAQLPLRGRGNPRLPGDAQTMESLPVYAEQERSDLHVMLRC